jgi:hypothetical protein
VIGVNVNRYDAKKLKKVMDKEKMTWRSFVDEGGIVAQWNLPAPRYSTSSTITASSVTSGWAAQPIISWEDSPTPRSSMRPLNS